MCSLTPWLVYRFGPARRSVTPRSRRARHVRGFAGALRHIDVVRPVAQHRASRAPDPRCGVVVLATSSDATRRTRPLGAPRPSQTDDPAAAHASTPCRDRRRRFAAVFVTGPGSGAARAGFRMPDLPACPVRAGAKSALKETKRGARETARSGRRGGGRRPPRSRSRSPEGPVSRRRPGCEPRSRRAR